MAGELEEGQMHTSQGNRGSEEEKLPPRARWVERVCGHLSDLDPPQHQAPVIAARPCPGLQPVRVKESAVGIRAALLSTRVKPKGAARQQKCMEVSSKHVNSAKQDTR